MTDITELAQREKFEAWAEEGNALPWGYLKKRRIYTGFYSEHTYTSLWAAWKAAGAELVEALEKAQQYAKERDAENQDLMLTVGRLRVEREGQESRTVKLPKPHAHLIWIQAGHAPDDFWDDVAVSHSEKDRCCDGSERYPVYAQWEIEEMLTAAGIKWEAE